MTPRQQLFASLNNEPNESLPVWLLFPWDTTSYYVDVRHHPAYLPVHEHSMGRAIILNRRNPEAPRFTGKADLPKLLEHDEDLEQLSQIEVETDAKQIAASLDEQMPKYMAEKEAFPIEYGSMMLDIGEPIKVLHEMCRQESLSIWSLTHDALVVDILDKLMEHFRHVYRYCLERDLADVHFMVGSELAAPPLVSHDTFRRWVIPYAKELIELVHSYDKKVIQHFHGQVHDLLPHFLDMAPDALHTIEAPPVGNCTLEQAFDIVGDRMTLIGNIQYDDFRAFSPEEMKETVLNMRAKFAGKRLILSPTAGPFDPNPPDRLIENYHAFLDGALDESGRSAAKRLNPEGRKSAPSCRSPGRPHNQSIFTKHNDKESTPC